MGTTTTPPAGRTCDPFDLYPLDTKSEIETLVLLAVAVAGRSPAVGWPKVKQIRDAAAGSKYSPFEYLRALGADGVGDYLREIRMGQYRRIGGAYRAVSALPAAWTWVDLIDCPGISYKTAKLVQVYTWPGGRGACLDRHVLRLLAKHPKTARALGPVPDTSPSDPVRYAALEGVALWLVDHYGLTPWQFDRVVWRAAAAGRDPVAELAAGGVN